MAYDCIDMISPDILQHDVLGALGCIYLPKRANLLCEIKARSFTEDDLVLQIQRYVPEGLGAELYDSEILTIPSDALLADVEHMLWDINQTIPPLATPVWILGVEEIDILRSTWDMAYRFSTFSKWHVLPSPERSPAVVRCLEMYAGAFVVGNRPFSFWDSTESKRKQWVLNWMRLHQKHMLLPTFLDGFRQTQFYQKPFS